MTNEEKAKELAIKSTRHTDDNGKELYNVFVEAALQEMAEWKEQQMIDKAVNFLNENLLCTLLFDKYDKENFIDNFRKAM